MLYTILIIVQVFVAIAMVLLILLQQGKGADAGAAFGAGASGTVFGARGSASFLSRATGILAFVFMANSTALAYMSHQQTAPTSVVERAAGNAAPGGAVNTPGTPTAQQEPVAPSEQAPASTAKPRSTATPKPVSVGRPPATRAGTTGNGAR